jgi:hypothetical protein
MLILYANVYIYLAYYPAFEWMTGNRFLPKSAHCGQNITPFPDRDNLSTIYASCGVGDGRIRPAGRPVL